MARTYLKLRRWFFAGRHRSADPAKASRTSRFSGLSLTCAVAWFSVAAMHGVQGRRVAMLHVVFGLLTWLLRVWGLRGGRVYLASHLLVGLSCAGIVAGAMLTGQVHAMALWFLAAVPLLVAYQFGERESVAWTAVALALNLGVGVSGLAVVVPPEFVPDGIEKTFNRTVLLLVVFVFALVARRTMDRNFRAIERQTVLANRQADDLRVARDHALAASQAKSEFLAGMSHELRTPLNSVIGFANVLLNRPFDVTEEKRADYLERIRRNGEHLLSVINDVLDMSKIEAGRTSLEFSDVSVVALIRETLDGFEADADERGVTLRAEGLQGTGNVVADRMRLKQVLLNLVGNALKFTESGSVTLRLVAHADGAPRRLDVIDTGIGIAPEMHERIFQPFSQADSSSSRRHGGTGLGLSISRSLLEMMGFGLTLESSVGRGSTFAIVFDRTFYTQQVQQGAN